VYVSEAEGGCRLQIRVIPRARRSGIEGVRGEALLVRLTAAPVDDQANAALIELLAKHLDLPKSSVVLVSGARSRSKTVRVTGLSADTIRTRLGQDASPP
jgi:uncharacterized protein (TIGR00251 family)